MTTVGKASIEIEVDGSGISRSLEAAMDRALAAVSKSADAAFGKVERGADSAGAGIGDGIGDGAKAAERALGSIDTDGIDNISKAASDAADSVSKSSADAADSLSDVGAAGSEAGATASAAMSSSMADISQAAASSGAAAAESLSGVGGAAAESGATASSSMASSMSDISATAASAFSSVSASAADAAAGVAQSASNMASSMSGALSGVSSAGTGATAGMSGLGGAIGGMTKKLGPAAAGMAGLAGAGATVKSGFDKLTSIEDTTASLGIILGDLDEASTLMAKLQEDNLQTPYMFDAYAAAGKTLAAFGADLEGIPGQVQALGEAAAASGGGQQVFDSMARSAGQAMATGKMSLDTINQLAVGGVQGLQILANHYDVPTSEMQKMVSQGMVPAQEGMDILTQGIMEGSDGAAGATQAMAGVMVEMSETTSGSMTNLVAAFTNLAAAGIEPLTPIIQTVVDGLTDFIYVIIDLISGEDLPGWLGTVATVLEPLAWIAGSVTAAFLALKIGSLALAGAKAVVAAATGGLSKAMTLLTGHPVIAAIAAIAGGLIWFFTQTETGQRIWEGLMDALGTAWEWLKGAFAGVWDTISEAAVGAFEWLQDAWNTLWEAFQSVWESVGQPIVDFVKAAFGLWWEGVKLYFRLLGAAWEVLWTGLQMAWDAFGQPIVDFIVAAFQLWWEGIQIIFGWLQDGWNMLWAGVQAVYDAVIAPVIGWVMDRFETMRSAVRTVIDAVKGAIQEFADRVSALYDTYVQPMVDSVTDGFNRIRDTIQEWKDKIIGWFSDAGTWLLDAGKNIVNGIIDGVKSMAGALRDAFLNIVPDWVKDPFMEAMGIASPSKVFIGYGKSIGEGLVEGIEGMHGAVGDAVSDLTDNAAPGELPPMPVAAPLEAAAAPLGAAVTDSHARPGAEAAGGATGPQIDNAGPVDLGGMFGDSLTDAADGIDPALVGMQENLALLGEEAMLQGGVMSDAMLAASTGIQDAKAVLFDPAQQGMRDSLNMTAATTQHAMLGTALPSVQHAGSGVMDVQVGTVDPALAGMRGAVANTAHSFAVGSQGIINEWSKTREGTAAPVRFTIQSVFNDGLVGMWNSVSDMLGTSKMQPYPLRFQKGGQVPGSGSGDKVPALLEPNEFVASRPMLKAIGGGDMARGLGMMESVRQRVGSGGGVSSKMGAEGLFNAVAGRYQRGGVVKGTPEYERFKRAHEFASKWHGAPYVWGGSLGPDGGTDCSGFMSSIADVIHGGSGLQRQWATGSFPGGGGSQGAAGPQGFVGGLGAGFAIGVSSVHTAGTLGGIPGLPTVNVESGGANPSMVKYGTGAAGADHSQFPSQYHLAFEGLGKFMSAGGGGGVASLVYGLIGDAWGDVQSALDNRPTQGGMIDEWPPAVAGGLKDAFDKTVEEAIIAMGADPGGEGAERWRPLAMRAMAMTGFDHTNSAQVDAMIKQIQTESGGNPGIVQQIVDVNSGGNEAQGLLQVIPGTFAAHRDTSLPNDRTHPLANMVAALNYYRSRYGADLTTTWGHGHGYDLGGIANGVGLMPKHILDPERVLSPRQTEAFEAWMDAGARVEDINKLVENLTWREDPANLPVVQPEKVLNADQEAVFDEWRGQGSQIDSIHELVDSMHGLQLDHPDVMGREIDRRFRAWLGEAPEDNTGDVRHLVAALEAGVEWERVTHGMQRSAEAWANGQWVQVAEDKRLATPDEMGQQLSENFLEELADELGGYIGLRGLYKGRDIVGESGLIKLELPDEVKDAEIVPSTEGAPVVATATPTATGKTSAGEAQNVEVTVNIDVSGVNDPMAVSDLVMAKVGKGVEEAIGTARSQ